MLVNVWCFSRLLAACILASRAAASECNVGDLEDTGSQCSHTKFSSSLLQRGTQIHSVNVALERMSQSAGGGQPGSDGLLGAGTPELETHQGDTPDEEGGSDPDDEEPKYSLNQPKASEVLQAMETAFGAKKKIHEVCTRPSDCQSNACAMEPDESEGVCMDGKQRAAKFWAEHIGIPAKPEDFEDHTEALFSSDETKLLAKCLVYLDDRDRESARAIFMAEHYLNKMEADSAFKAKAEKSEIVQSTIQNGKDAAIEVALQEFQAITMDDMSGHHESRKAIEAYATLVGNLAKMCGDHEEADELAADERHLMDDGEANSTRAGYMGKSEAGLAYDLALLVESKCKTDSLDLSYFVDFYFQDHDGACSKLVSSSFMELASEHGKALDMRAKSVLAVHSEQNKIGHHLVDHLLGETDQHEFANRVRETVSSGLSHSALARLHYVEEKHYADVHGQSKDEYCKRHSTLVETEPMHWISQNKELEAYTECLCVEKKPAFVCDNTHALDLERARTEFLLFFKRGVAMAQGSVSTSEHANTTTMKVGLGPCGIPKTGCDSYGQPVTCKLCAGSTCVDTGGAHSVDVFGGIKALFDMPSPCLSGSCTLCMGIKPCDPFTLELELGAKLNSCIDPAAMMSTFHLFMEPKMCLGGVVKDVLNLLGLTTCETIGSMAYFPFLGKFAAHLNMPVGLPPPFGVRGQIGFSMPIHDLTKAVTDYCSRADDIVDTVMMMALQEVALRALVRERCEVFQAEQEAEIAQKESDTREYAGNRQCKCDSRGVQARSDAKLNWCWLDQGTCTAGNGAAVSGWTWSRCYGIAGRSYGQQTATGLRSSCVPPRGCHCDTSGRQPHGNDRSLDWCWLSQGPCIISDQFKHEGRSADYPVVDWSWTRCFAVLGVPRPGFNQPTATCSPAGASTVDLLELHQPNYEGRHACRAWGQSQNERVISQESCWSSNWAVRQLCELRDAAINYLANPGIPQSAKDATIEKFRSQFQGNCLEPFRKARGSLSVVLKVQALIGIRIPFVGEVGKWQDVFKKTFD